MMGLVEEVLDFSKIEAGKLVLERTDFDLHALVNSTCRILSSQAAVKGVEFVVSIMPEVPPAVRGDAHHLRQVLINLAGNAVKFTEHGSVDGARQQPGGNRTGVRLKFSVRDTGIGIAPEAQERIFESFTQADQTTTRRFGGTGLGTTIAKQLVETDGRPDRHGERGRPGQHVLVRDGVGEAARTRRRWCRGARRRSVLLVGLPAGQREALEQSLAAGAPPPVAVGSVDEGVQPPRARRSASAKPYHSAMLFSEGKDLQLAQTFPPRGARPAPPWCWRSAQRRMCRACLRCRRVRRGARIAVRQAPAVQRAAFGHGGRGSARRCGAAAGLRAPRRQPEGLNVLVADDNPTNREVLARILERGGHTRPSVRRERALDALENSHFVLALIDRNMPRLSGHRDRAGDPPDGRRARAPAGGVLSADCDAGSKARMPGGGRRRLPRKPIEAARLLEECRRCAPAKPQGRGSRRRSKACARRRGARIRGRRQS
jgi:two-component system sensor histidine kinase RpfC